MEHQNFKAVASGLKTDFINVFRDKSPCCPLCSRSPLRMSGQNKSFVLAPSRPKHLSISETLYLENRYGKDGNKLSKKKGTCFAERGFLRSPQTERYADSYLSCNQEVERQIQVYYAENKTK